MASKLADILQQEYKTKGLIGGAASALSKSSREKMDIRNVLFGGSGLGSIIGRKVFGKGYSAIDGGSKVSNVSEAISSGSASVLSEISINSAVTAKNTLALPSMARDMFLVKKNILQLVKLQGGTPSTKAGDWFNRQQARENAYESKFTKTMPSTSPSKVEPKKDSGFGLLGLTGLFGVLGSAFNSVLKPISFLKDVLITAGLAVVLFGRTIRRFFRFLLRTKIGKLLGLTGLAIGASKAFGEDNLEDDSENNYEPNNVQTNEKSDIGGTLINAAAGVGGALAGASAIGAGSKLITAGKATSAAVLEAKTMSVGQLAKSTPKSRWGKFLAFVAKKSPQLWGRVALKLAQAGALATIPIVGWVAAAVQLGFSIWTAWEIYELWREFTNNEETETATTEETPNVSPTQQPQQTGLSGKLNALNESAKGSGSTSPTPASGAQSAGQPMADLIRQKFKAAGFGDAQAEAAVANAYAESSLDPMARNNNGKEDSVGLFQMNRKGGLGTGYSVEQLQDPNFNIDLAIAAAKKSNAFVNATSVQDAVAAFVKDVERPANQSAAIAKRIDIANNITGKNLNLGSTALAAASRPSGGGTQVVDAKTINNNTQTGSSGGTQVAAYDSDMMKYLLRPVS